MAKLSSVFRQKVVQVERNTKKIVHLHPKFKKENNMMKKLLFLLSTVCCFCFCACKEEKLAIAGSGWNEIAIVSKKTGMIEWKHALNTGDECNDIEVTPDGNVLFAYSKGAKLINRNHETIWDYKAGENEEIHTATRLKEGGYMVAVCGDPARIVELDPTGKPSHELSFPTFIFNNTHNQFRQVLKTDEGIYHIPLIKKRIIMRISTDGQLKGTVDVGQDLFSVIELENKNLLVSCGKDSRFIEINPAKQQRDSMLVTSNIQGGILRYVAEIVLYENGHKLIANSNMNSDDKSQPLLLEIDKENNVVWSLPYNKEIKNITAVYSFFE